MAKGKVESLGYPALEAFIEQKVVDLEPMMSSHKKLETFFKTSKSAQGKAAAKNGMLAYQRFFELMSELFRIRADLAKAAVKKGKSQ